MPEEQRPSARRSTAPDKSGRPYKTYRSTGRARRQRAGDVAAGAGDTPAFDPTLRYEDFDEAQREDLLQQAGERPPRRRRRAPWKIVLFAALAVLVAALLAVGLWSYFAWRTVDAAVRIANGRIDAPTHAALTPDQGGIFSHPTVILVLGVDKRPNDPGRSDSIMLLRSNPGTHSISQLSIARDMLVDVPGHGSGKINTGFFWGGPALAIRTVSQFTGVKINHVVVVNFHGFEKVIDAVGGVDISVPRTISSIYTGGRTVTFRKGLNHMDGKRAMIYARIRKLDNDFYRQARQQQVVQALQKKLSGFGNLSHLPSNAAGVVRYLSTDLTTWQLTQLAWRKWRASHTYQYVLRGTPAMIGGQSYVMSDRAANLRLIHAFMTN
jgi:LCP family protein required for cell wall assembly